MAILFTPALGYKLCTEGSCSGVLVLAESQKTQEDKLELAVVSQKRKMTEGQANAVTFQWHRSVQLHCGLNAVPLEWAMLRAGQLFSFCSISLSDAHLLVGKLAPELSVELVAKCALRDVAILIVFLLLSACADPWKGFKNKIRAPGMPT